MSEVSPTRETSMETEEDKEEQQQQQHTDRGRRRLVLPEDGFEWKKYGQKFIKNIGKFRGYFRCQKRNCMAKKRAEWSNPENLRIVYEGSHSHASSTQDSSSASSQGTPSSSAANQYNLYTQLFGNQPASSTHDQDHT
ncbi:WRKY transcription factor 44-like [Populus nigra]|uniref:WRKY transcription factor 44-like n=1 Tax=Populus nigra TaxID=3691 RepID=UPI002B26B907|nr:WRKY transcription factor 44-like [Populus nigra]